MVFRNDIPETVVMKHVGIAFLSSSWLILCAVLFLLLFVFHSLALAGNYYLYLPNQVDTARFPRPGAGVLVQKIIIKRGDTLSALSRKFSGNGTYYSQILLFNKIHNPNLIYAGQELLVPIARRISVHVQPRQIPGAPTPSCDRINNHSQQRTATEDLGENLALSAERHLYDQSVALFTQGKFRKALEGFTQFLQKYPQSSLAPDATLYRGDCFLRLSGI